jgi:hypothetical protein
MEQRGKHRRQEEGQNEAGTMTELEDLHEKRRIGENGDRI